MKKYENLILANEYPISNSRSEAKTGFRHAKAGLRFATAVDYWMLRKEGIRQQCLYPNLSGVARRAKTD